MSIHAYKKNNKERGIFDAPFFKHDYEILVLFVKLSYILQFIFLDNL